MAHGGALAARLRIGRRPSKVKRPEPGSRTYCHVLPPTPESPILRSFKCQNAPLSLFAEKLPGVAPGVNLPVYDATGLEGNWDFTLIVDPTPYASLPTRDRPPDSASDPIGGSTIFDSLEKQLGLKLETQKRTRMVIVIDHLDQKPTEN